MSIRNKLRNKQYRLVNNFNVNKYRWENLEREIMKKKDYNLYYKKIIQAYKYRQYFFYNKSLY